MRSNTLSSQAVVGRMVSSIHRRGMGAARGIVVKLHQTAQAAVQAALASICWTLLAGAPVMAIRRGFMASGICRTSSIFKRPLSKAAPLTSTWSARLNWRLKLRVEMPRYRNSRSAFSALLPSMVTTSAPP